MSNEIRSNFGRNSNVFVQNSIKNIGNVQLVTHVREEQIKIGENNLLVLLVLQYELFDEQIADLEQLFHAFSSIEWHFQNFDHVFVHIQVQKHVLDLVVWFSQIWNRWAKQKKTGFKKRMQLFC